MARVVQSGETLLIASGDTASGQPLELAGQMDLDGQYQLADTPDRFASAAGVGAATGTAAASANRAASASGVGSGVGAAVATRARLVSAAGSGVGVGMATATPERFVSAAGAGQGFGVTADGIVVVPIVRRDKQGIEWHESDDFTLETDG